MTPLIWTTLGNVPVDSLEHKTEWLDGADFIKFREWYEKDGVTVKESAHVYVKQGQTAGVVAGDF